jgi:hypothetical protein
MCQALTSTSSHVDEALKLDTQAQVGGNPTFYFSSPIVSKTNSTHYFHLDFTRVPLVPTFLFHGTLQSTNGSILGFGLLFIIDQLRYLINLCLVLEITYLVQFAFCVILLSLVILYMVSLQSF